MKLLILFCLFFSFSSFSELRLSEKEEKELKEATVLIQSSNIPYVIDPLRADGTGFLISSNEIATVAHNFFSLTRFGSITVTFNPGEKNEMKIKASLKQEDTIADIAILELEKKVDIRPLTLEKVENVNWKEYPEIAIPRYPEYKSSYGKVIDDFRYPTFLDPEAYDWELYNIEGVGPIENFILDFLFPETWVYYNLLSTVSVESGTSGAPLYHVKTKKVIGIVVSKLSNNPEVHLIAQDFSNVAIVTGAVYSNHMINFRKNGDANIDRDLLEKGLPVAITAKAGEHFLNKNYEESFPAFKKAAELGDVRAKAGLMLSYEYGFGVPKNEAEALKLQNEILKDTLLQSSPGEIQSLSGFYEARGDIEKSLVLFEKMEMFAEHKLWIAIFHEAGLELEKDLERARELYEKAIVAMGGLEVLKEYRRLLSSENFPSTFLEAYAFLYFYLDNKPQQFFEDAQSLIIEDFEFHTKEDFKNLERYIDLDAFQSAKEPF